jgi:hypothetical protein
MEIGYDVLFNLCWNERNVKEIHDIEPIDFFYKAYYYKDITDNQI